MIELSDKKKAAVWSVIVVGGTLLSLFLLLLSINEIKQIGQPLQSPAATNTITVTGEGDAIAIPDIATFSFEVTETATAVADAQTAATTKTNAAIKAMTDGGVAPADIQTLSYDINPHYEYTNSVCIPGGICNPSKSTITGYDVSETIQVKVRNLSNAGTLLAAVGALGVQNVDSLQFSVDNPDAVQDAARAKAIAAAQAKAASLASELGVHLVRVVDFSENNGGVVQPVMYAADAMSASTGAAPVPPPTISAGQQKVTSDVSITYEIR